MLFSPIFNFIDLQFALSSGQGCYFCVQLEISGIKDGSPHMRSAENSDGEGGG